MAWNDRTASLIWVALGICQCIESWRLGLGSFREPGTGFMPFFVGLVMIMLSVFLFIEASVEIREKAAKKVLIWADVEWKRIICIVFGVMGYALMLDTLGYPLSTFLFMVFALKTGDAIKWCWTILIGLITSALSLVIFGIWLGVSFPAGIFSF